MSYQEQLVQKIQRLPPSLLPVVDLFVDFLLTRYSVKTAEENRLDKEANQGKEAFYEFDAWHSF